MLRRQQFPDLLSNHLMCHIAPRNFQNFLPCRPNTQHVIAKVCFTAVVQCWGISMQSWAEEEVAHYKPREEAVISLSWKLRICQGAKFSPILTPSSPNFSFVPVSCLRPDGLEILNGNQAVCQFTPGSPWRRRSSQWKFAPKISYKTIACGTWYVKGMEISRKNSRNFLQTNWLLGRCSEVRSTFSELSGGGKLPVYWSTLISISVCLEKHEPRREPNLIFVTGSARVKNSVRCNIFQIERTNIHILLF